MVEIAKYCSRARSMIQLMETVAARCVTAPKKCGLLLMKNSFSSEEGASLKPKPPLASPKSIKFSVTIFLTSPHKLYRAGQMMKCQKLYAHSPTYSMMTWNIATSVASTPTFQLSDENSRLLSSGVCVYLRQAAQANDELPEIMKQTAFSLPEGTRGYDTADHETMPLGTAVLNTITSTKRYYKTEV
ncbi:hypothetical protein L207DRAFT_531724 [Hyaloscypha variabilis F]|uniref:Uncharacterized protein n=1 Tax=Hyaloscypha variabilis (strain UAMH 11265 / GT02V1 / F) TaxID=1149755 RepID=A0A2J6RFZ3_HYAVF|nr:hypothetical protein L207DRAFT_531724 [Hyaloscypha variabilis F]